MITGQNSKFVSALKPQSVATSATAGDNVDTLGYSYAQFLVHLNSATDNPSVFKLTEGDTTSSYADVTAFVGDTAWTIPAHDTANAQLVQLNVDLKGRKRHLKLAITPAAAHIMSATCELTRGKMAITTTERGVAAVVTG